MAMPLTIISSMATKQLLADLLAQYATLSPQPVTVESVGGVDAAKRVLAGNAIGQLTEAGKLVAGSRADIVRSGVAIAVRAGAPRPAIATEDDIKQAVMKARSLSYSTGPSGVALAKLFERWGIADEIKSRIVQAPPGVPVGSLVADGKVELGFQQLSELMSLPGIDVLGPLPDAIQIITTFSGGVSVTSTQADAARALLAFMASPAALETKRRNGMEPA
jgi:molybdate transport system substrate-binding protein